MDPPYYRHGSRYPWLLGIPGKKITQNKLCFAIGDLVSIKAYYRFLNCVSPNKTSRSFSVKLPDGLSSASTSLPRFTADRL